MESSEMRKYAIKYKVEFGEFSQEEARPSGFAATDEILICSIVKFNKRPPTCLDPHGFPLVGQGLMRYHTWVDLWL